MEEILAHQALAPAAGLQAIQSLDSHLHQHNHPTSDPYTSVVLHPEFILTSTLNYNEHIQNR